ncbi:transaldolase [Ophiostoma piceae UAMH 11346]|uniref:Transaldolase n=1 Tax=Ophiostoma piceae (strain UAMH 11346) TaxID=1262450 RepID=S3C9C1_OPHP1|nr:transaldolase [Ophiostoma piceae UAMH 11346]
MAPITWLDKLEQELDIDIDWMDSDFLRSYLPKIRFHDQTSNQGFVDVQLDHPSNAQLIIDTAREVKAEHEDAASTNTLLKQHPLWVAIYTRMSVLMAAKNVDLISGRTLLQTLPSLAYDYEATLAHAHLYAAEFARVGVSRDRFCIKIPSTGPALNAAKTLQTEGIQTLGTALFGLAQAIACSQARCLSISPYYNDVRVHTDRSVWPETKDPAVEHPNSPRILQILEAYRRLYKETGQDQPLMKNASFVNAEESMAAGEMGCQSVTLFHGIIEDLASRPYDPESPTRPGGKAAEGRPKPEHHYRDRPDVNDRLKPLLEVDHLSKASAAPDYDALSKVDYLADNGKALDAAIKADTAAADRLDVALTLFITAENSSRAKVEKALAAI